ncbi:MAG TPA: phage tail fiber protein [Crenalkalicoccus sp.]|jgi:hypothetical protein|nr:phage tail fiber protein [Crenalkalicoccus sp.]
MSDHIRIGDIAPRVQYLADGVQTAFTYPFPIFEAADLEVRLDGLLQAAGFIVSGAGETRGGSVAFAVPPPRGTSVVLRRNLVVERVTDFQENGILRANTLNDELDYQVAALQEVKDDLSTTLRLDPSEVGALSLLPLRSARANRLLGFDSVGDVTVFDRGGTITLPYPGGIPRTVEDKLAERISARDFGAVGNGATDDGPALQAAMNAAAAAARMLEIGEGTFRTTMPLTLPGAAAGLLMRGAILYDGPAGQAALTLGDGGAVDNQAKRYLGLAVLRNQQSDWSSEADIGIRLRNLDACVVQVVRAERFTIGVQVVGDARGSEDSDLHYGRLTDNAIGLDLRTLTASAWMNSLRHHGGHFACSSGTNPGRPRFGVRFSAEPGAYTLHNAHLFLGPAFELQRHGTPGTVDAIPFLVDVDDARGITALGIRMEQCSPFVARHTGGANDCVYEVSYVGTYGYQGCAVDYTGSATRAGGTVIARHQAAAATGTPRLVADAGNVRARAFRWNATDTGFEAMAMLSSNPSGSPSTLNGLCFPGLPDIGLNTNSVTLPTSRALAFVVDARRCREFFLAAEGVNLRPVVMQFDGSENVLTDAAPLLMSNMNVAWKGSPSFWWEGNADLDDLSGGFALNWLQRVTLNAACRYAAIGVRGSTAAAELNSLRLFCAADQAPSVLYGGGRRWGRRELTAIATWDPPNVASGGTASLGVPVPDAAPGDTVAVGFDKATTLLFLGQVSATSPPPATVTVRLWNPTNQAIDLDPGNVIVRVTKPLL